MTPAEHRLWNRLRANRLGGWHFRRQQIISGFIVDFYCHKARLVIEVDGPIHIQQATEDAPREEVLIEHGLKILRFTNQEVMNNLNHVLQIISAQLESNSPS
jgi:very-short-patch-repair endonuclease